MRRVTTFGLGVFLATVYILGWVWGVQDARIRQEGVLDAEARLSFAPDLTGQDTRPLFPDPRFRLRILPDLARKGWLVLGYGRTPLTALVPADYHHGEFHDLVPVRGDPCHGVLLERRGPFAEVVVRPQPALPVPCGVCLDLTLAPGVEGTLSWDAGHGFDDERAMSFRGRKLRGRYWFLITPDRRSGESEARPRAIRALRFRFESPGPCRVPVAAFRSLEVYASGEFFAAAASRILRCRRCAPPRRICRFCEDAKA